MSKPKKKGTRKPPRRKGTMTADVVVQSSPTRAFLATVEGVGRDEQGRVVGTNGIKWKVA